MQQKNIRIPKIVDDHFCVIYIYYLCLQNKIAYLFLFHNKFNIIKQIIIINNDVHANVDDHDYNHHHHHHHDIIIA